MPTPVGDDIATTQKSQKRLQVIDSIEIGRRKSPKNVIWCRTRVFKTLKYRPQLPVKPFKDLLEARRWVTQLLHWYNEVHRHSAISFVTPAQRHAGLDAALLKARKAVYETARQANPNRWSKDTRSWPYESAVHLNPDSPASKESNTELKAA